MADSHSLSHFPSPCRPETGPVSINHRAQQHPPASTCTPGSTAAAPHSTPLTTSFAGRIPPAEGRLRQVQVPRHLRDGLTLFQHQIHRSGLEFGAEVTSLPPLLLPLRPTTTSEVSREADEAQCQPSRSCSILRRSSRAFCTAILRSPRPLALYHSRKHSPHMASLE